MSESSCPTCPRHTVKVSAAKADLARVARHCANARFGPNAKQLAQLDKAKAQVAAEELSIAEHLAAEH